MMEEFSPKVRKMDEQEIFKKSFAEVEKCFRELKSELFMKRNEVLKLKSELELTNQENHKLRASLDKLKKDSEENQITMDLFMKKSKEFEPKYYEKRDALLKLELQYKIANSKIDVLREDLQNATMQKAQLVRKVDVFQEKQTRDCLYSNEISQKLIQLKSTIETVTEDLGKLKIEQNIATTVSQKVDLAQESLQKCEEVYKLSQKLKEENEDLKAQSVLLKAKFERLNSFFTKNSLTKESDLQARVLLTQCTKISNFYKESMVTKNALLSDLNKHLCDEKVVNIKLIQENEVLANKLISLKEEVIDLQTKLNLFEPKQFQELPEVEAIKVEPDDNIIEITDD